jgi:hypothetical protein|nr:MAG TPA: hypothetical protein [Crassvirales sp.]
MIQDIKYMDINHYNDLISKNDYLGAATYAKGFTSNDPIQRRNLEKGVGMLESEGRKYQAIINKAKPDQKDAVSFLYGLKTGSLDLRKGKDGQYINRYVREFKDTINNLGNTSSQYVAINFSPKTINRGFFGIDFLAKDVQRKESGYDRFKNISGLNEDSLQKMGVNVSNNNDGSTTIYFRKDISDADKFKLISYARKVTFDDDESKGIGYMIGGSEKVGGKVITGHEGNDAHYSSLIVKNFDPEYYDIGNKKINRFVDNVEKINKDFDFEDKTTDVQILDAPYITEKQAMAEAQGDEKTVKAEVDGVLRQLTTINLQDYETYYRDNDDKEAALVKLDNVDKQNDLTAMLRTMSTEEKSQLRVKKAISGDKIGWHIYIPNTKHWYGIDTENAELFIVDPRIGDSLEDSWANSTQVKAIKEAATMSKYNYSREIPYKNASNGKATITPVEGTNQYTINFNGHDQGTIDRTEAQKYLNAQFIMDDTVSQLRNNMYNPDGSKRNYVNLKQDASIVAMQAMKEIEPEAYQRVAPSIAKIGNIYNDDGTVNKSVYDKLDEQTKYDFDYFNNAYEYLVQSIINKLNNE